MIAKGWIGPRSSAPQDDVDEGTTLARRRAAAVSHGAVPLHALPDFILSAALHAHRGTVGDACQLHDALRLAATIVVSWRKATHVAQTCTV
jgi:hypothetical protein